MMNLLGMAAAIGVLVLIWLALPLLMAPLVLVGALLSHSVAPRTRRVRAPQGRRADVHELATLHPRDHVRLAA